ncbi:MAG: cell wall protein [Firmicutes bacterium]|nr:cell wall protein [Bacillota bacterium]
MENKEINAKINHAFNSMVPDVLDSVLSAQEKQKGEVIVLTERKKKNHWITRISGVAAALLILLVGIGGFNYYNTNYTVDSTVSFDVNPSIEIRINRHEQVLGTDALNDDGAVVMGDMDFKGSTLDVTVNAIIGSMLRNGYLSELANSILISVENSDPVKGAQLQMRLAREIDDLLKISSFNGAVLSQVISHEKELQELADTYGITYGKAQLIRNITEESSLYRFEDLVPLSINDLNLLCSLGAADLDKVESAGKASDKAYIGTEAAKKIAFDHAGKTASDVRAVKVEMDWEHGAMVYEVEFKYGGYEYEYEIDAKSGAIRQFERERDDDNITADTTPKPQPPASSEYIGEIKAKEIALADAGLPAGSITGYSIKLDYEDGIAVYEVEFKHGGYEYEYEIDAKSGAIRQFERKLDD